MKFLMECLEFKIEIFKDEIRNGANKKKLDP